MHMIYWAIIVLGVFAAIWLLFVAPAERRHHERKLAILQKKIDARRNQPRREADDAANEQCNDSRECQ
jgi:predicted MFS family arabinose efflux permease